MGKNNVSGFAPFSGFACKTPQSEPQAASLKVALKSSLKIALTLTLLAASAAAQEPETIVYPGAAPQAIWTATSNDLAPSGNYQRGGTINLDGWSNSLNNNIITVNSGNIDNVFGAYYHITTYPPPGPQHPNELTGNKITVHTGTVNNNIYGAYLYIEYTNDVLSTALKNNLVDIKGGLFNGNVFGGSAMILGNVASTAEALSTGNVVNISGGTVTWGVRGGDANARGDIAEAYATGNIVNISGGTMWGVTGGYAVADITSTTHASNTIDGAVAPQSSGQKGAVLNYEYDISIVKQVLATAASVQARPESKILSEGFLAGSILLNQTGDMIAQRTEQARRGVFFNITGGSSRYNTGSHIDIKGYSLLTGLTRRVLCHWHWI